MGRKKKTEEKLMDAIYETGFPPPPHPAPLLRPLKAYLWDTETLVPPEEHLGFFERPISASMRWAHHVKDRFDTNPTMASTIPNPQIFHLYGVHVTYCGASPAELERLLFDGRIIFRFAGDRIYFESMLSDVTTSGKSTPRWRRAILDYTKREQLLVGPDGKIIDRVGHPMRPLLKTRALKL